MNNRLVQKSKRLLSGIVAAAIATSMLPTLPAVAETGEKYPYTLFAGSSAEGAITVNAGNFCINGNVATNGTIVSSGNMNVNGTKTENAGFDMIYIFDKIDTKYFSGNNVEEHTEDCFLDELNININTPTEVLGEAELTGNININTALKAFEDVTLNGEVKNTNDSVIYSKYGDIVIDSTNVNLNGLVYAPFGSVEVKAMNLNLNNVVIIADSIVLDCPNVNANYPVQFEGEVKWNFIFPYLDSNLVEVIVSAFSSFGSVALDFRYDDEHIALHSDTTQWQSIGGYNDFYDWVFNTATSMNKLKLDFTLSTNNQDYVVWAWKGNYLNLGAGSEVGFYTQNETLETLEKNFKLEHWMVSDELPMTLSLYKVAGNGLIYDTYYHWLPDENQWWITGFVPDVYDQWLSSKFGLDWGDTVTEDELLQIASVKLCNMYNAFKRKYSPDDLNMMLNFSDETPYTLIFDDKEEMVWIYW